MEKDRESEKLIDDGNLREGLLKGLSSRRCKLDYEKLSRIK